MKSFKLSLAIVLSLLLVSYMIYGKDTWKESKFFTNQQETLQVEVPSNWEVLQLNEEAQIQVGNLAQETYYIVIPEVKVDLHGWNIDKHSKITLGNLLYLVDFPEIVGPRNININGYSGIQYEVHGANQGLNISYILTTVETPEHFHQILAWTLKSRFDKNKKVLKKAIESFQEIPSSK